MNKRILSILLGLMLVVSLLVLAVPASAAPVNPTLTITADKTEAAPGDTITYTITLGPVEALNYFQTSLDIPSGLTFVAGSGKEIEGAAAASGFKAFDVKDTLVVNGIVDKTDYSSESSLDIATFQCTVDDDATGVLTVSTVDDDTEAGNGNWDDLTLSIVLNDSVTITAAPATAAPATEAPETEAPATEAPVTDAPVVTEAPATEAPATEAHVHNPVYVGRVEPTPEKDGIDEHYECSCGKWFKDSTGAIETNEDELRIPYVAPTEAPETEAPQTEAPATEAPATEAPATEAPATEAPATEAPATEAPATEAPATEEPTPIETEAPVETDAPVVTEAPVETDAPVVTEAPATGDESTKDQSTKDSSTKDSSTKDSSSTSPKTGDNTHMYLWMLIMLASLAGAGVVLYTAKRKGVFTK